MIYINKNIVLFGNAKSVLNKKRKIDDKFDIICRINAGHPKGKEKYIGNRTDILFLSLTLTEKEIKNFGTKEIIWCSPKRSLMNSWLQRHTKKFSLSRWSKLYNILKVGRPSTGLMAFEYLLDKPFKSLTLLGFDFWQTPNHYTNNIHLAQHNPQAEQTYIEQKIEQSKGRIKWIKTI